MGKKLTDEQLKIKQLLKQKAKLVARNLELEIESRIIERKLSIIGNKINGLIGDIVEEKPVLNMEEIRVAQLNKFNAAKMVRQRYPEMGMQEAMHMVETSLGARRAE